MLETNGKRIKKLRIKNKITQKQLADGLNVSKSTISYYEKGMRNISIDILVEIADFFDVDINVLIGRDNKVSSKLKDFKVSDEEIKFVKILRKMKCYKNLVANPEEFARIVDYETKDYDVEIEDVPL